MNTYKAIHKIMDRIYTDFPFVEKSRISVWIKKGDSSDSYVVIHSQDGNVEYELFYFVNRKGETLKKRDILVLLHEISHIVILEKIRKEKGLKHWKSLINNYNEEVEMLGLKSRKEKYDESKIQYLYQNIELEEKTNLLAKMLYSLYFPLLLE